MNPGLKEQLLASPSIIGLKPTCLTEKSGKWSVVVKNLQKERARNDID